MLAFVILFSVCCPWLSRFFSIADTQLLLCTEENSRPALPNLRVASPGLVELIHSAWHSDPIKRPSFSKIVKDLTRLRSMADTATEESPGVPLHDLQKLDEHLAKLILTMPSTGLPPDTCECFPSPNNLLHRIMD